MGQEEPLDPEEQIRRLRLERARLEDDVATPGDGGGGGVSLVCARWLGEPRAGLAFWRLGFSARCWSRAVFF